MTAYQFNSDKIKSIAIEHEKEILEDLGFDIPAYGNIQCPCPIHGGDNPTGFSYNFDINIWKCWTHHCDEKYGTDIIGLIRGIKNWSKKYAEIYVSKFAKDGYKYVLRTKEPIDLTQNFYDKSILPTNHKVQYFLDKGFKQETLNQFGAFYCDTHFKKLYGRACIPIFTMNNELVGFAGRKTEIIQHSPRKWLYQPKGIKLSLNLFGIQFAKQAIADTGIVYLVEGPLDVIRMHEAGFINTVSTFSNKINKNQINLLLKLNIKKVIIVFDPDEAGKEGAIKTYDKLSKYFQTSIVNNLPKDPAKLEIKELQELLK